MASPISLKPAVRPWRAHLDRTADLGRKMPENRDFLPMAARFIACTPLPPAPSGGQDLALTK